MIPTALEALKEAVEVARSYYMLFHDETWKERLTRWEAALQQTAVVSPSGQLNEHEQIAHAMCRKAGCKCSTPLLGWTEHNTPRCRLCNVEASPSGRAQEIGDPCIEWEVDPDGDMVVALRGSKGNFLAAHGKTHHEALARFGEVLTLAFGDAISAPPSREGEP